MITFCRQELPQLLVNDCGLTSDRAAAIGQDILNRAEAFASYDEPTRDVLIAPFIEEAAWHDPRNAALELRAAVTVVVRNSLLEEAHVDRAVKAEHIRLITTAAAGPLSHLLASRRRTPLDALPGPDPFRGLAQRYPRAWAALTALVEAIPAGGRHAYRLPEAPLPELPAGDALVDSKPSEENDQHLVLSAIEPRFDRYIVERLQLAVDGQPTTLFVPALSRLSRNSNNLCRIIEITLAYDSQILTTNTLIRPDDVWVRRGVPVRPDSYESLAGLKDIQGLSGSHRKLAETMLRQLGE